MTAQEFLCEAREKISDDPFTRLGPAARAAVADPQCVYDIHCHIFDRKCLNILYIALRMARNEIGEALGFEANDGLEAKLNLLKKSDEALYHEIEKQLPETEADWENFEKEIDALRELADYEAFGFNWADLKQAIEVLKKGSMAAVFDQYLEKFAINCVGQHSGRPIVVGILMMDLETGWPKMSPQKRFSQQLTELQELSKIRPILPFFAIDPRRADLPGDDENLYRLFLKAFTSGDAPFFGVKCYPSLGYFPSDARLDPIFQICAEKNIPVTTHCGAEIVSTYEKEIVVCDDHGLKKYKIPGDNRKERARFLNNPAHWEPVLERHNALKLNLAHFGGDSNWTDFGRGNGNERVDKITQMLLREGHNVFTDFSYNVAKDAVFGAFKGHLDGQPAVKSRAMFGTDFWVVLPAGDLVAKQAAFFAAMEAHCGSLVDEVPRRFLFEKTFVVGPPVVV